LKNLQPPKCLLALRLEQQQHLTYFDRGRLIAGNKADFILYSTNDYRDILYYQGSLRPSKIWKSGKLVSA